MAKKTKAPKHHDDEAEHEVAEQPRHAEPAAPPPAPPPAPEPRATVTFASVMATLNVTKKQLLLLMSNPQFPVETGGQSSDAATFLDTDISAFATKLHNAKANGFAVLESNLINADFNAMSAATAGRQYKGTFGDPIDWLLVDGNNSRQIVGP